MKVLWEILFFDSFDGVFEKEKYNDFVFEE